MVAIPARLMPHQISFKPYKGQGPNGKVWGAPVAVERAYVEDKVHVVRAQDGVETTSNTFIVVDPDVNVPEESLVTVWAGTDRERESGVINTAYFQHPRAPSHLVIYLE